MKKYFFYLIFIFNFQAYTEEKMIEVFKKQLDFCEKLKDPKSVQACKNNVILMLAKQNLINSSTQNQNNQNNQNNGNKKNDNNNKELLAHFANIVANIGKIAVEPHDPNNVQNLFNIFAGILNIASTVTRKMPKIEKEEIDKIVQDIDEKTKQQLADISYNEATKINKSYMKIEN